MRVNLQPSPKPIEELGCGVDVIVYEMHKRLSQYGVELVRPNERHDLFATHISAQGKEPPDVVHCHGLYQTGEAELESWTYALNARVINSLRAAYTVTVPSPYVAQMFERDMGFSPRVVPHGLDTAEWPEHSRTFGRKPRILWNKNRSSDVCSPLPLNDLASKFPDGDFITTFGAEAKNVTITGSMPFPKMKDLIYTCDVYFSSTKETFGIGILEALIAGLPVIAWNWGNAPTLVTHKVDGWVCDPGDIEATYNGLRYILDNYTAMTKAAREKALQYDWSKIMPLYVEAYKEAKELKAKERKGHVTVVIPCYNYAVFIGDAIASVKAQTYTDWDCIVVNDGSKDGSIDVIKAAAEEDPRFTIIDKPNEGVAIARNTGAMRAEGPYLMFLDADDALRPNGMELLVRELKNDQTLGLVFGRIGVIDGQGKKVAETSDWPSRLVLQDQLAQKNQIPSCNMMRLRHFKRTGGFRQRFAPCEDAELWTRLMLSGAGTKFIDSKKPVYDYRVHGKSASSAYRDAGKTEPAWLSWIPAANGGHMPFASVITNNDRSSYPVLDYDNPTVSIIIPCGPSHQGLLDNALDSVFSQTNPRWEVIVVDDTDGDVGNYGLVPYKVRYPFVKWVKNPAPHNVSAARNFGVANSKGYYITFLDADDFLYPNFISDMLKVIEECGDDSVIVYSDWISLPDNKVHHAENWNVDKLRDHALFAITAMLPRTAFDTVKGFDEELDLWEDWDLWIKIGMSGYKGIRVPKPLFAYKYDTGERREKSLAEKDRLLRTIRGKYQSAVPAPRRH